MSPRQVLVKQIGSEGGEASSVGPAQPPKDAYFSVETCTLSLFTRINSLKETNKLCCIAKGYNMHALKAQLLSKVA